MRDGRPNRFSCGASVAHSRANQPGEAGNLAESWRFGVRNDPFPERAEPHLFRRR